MREKVPLTHKKAKLKHLTEEAHKTEGQTDRRAGRSATDS